LPGHRREGFWLVVGTVIGTVVALTTASFTYKVGVAQSAAEYIRILGDRAVPASAKMLALSAMLEKDLVDTDILFDAAYALEDEYKIRLTQQFLYLVADRQIKPRCPIGYVDGPRVDSIEPVDGSYHIWGWALDDLGVDRIILEADGTEHPEFRPKTMERPDIAHVFKAFGAEQSRLKSGFHFEIPVSLMAGSTHLITIRIWDREYRFRDIFSRQVHFLPPPT
jgi:hypothetical protein